MNLRKGPILSVLCTLMICLSSECQEITHPSHTASVNLNDSGGITPETGGHDGATGDTVADISCDVCDPCDPASWRIHTNAVAWAMAIANLGAECSFSAHWSAALSLYYSAWNYTEESCKFRTFLIRPEVRWWLSPVNHGFFAEAHLGLAYYNFAMPSWNYRIQDRDGRHPALGGGIGIGYRLPFRNRRWAFEALVGAGVYHLSYDRFENRHNGPLHDTHSRTWFGIDNLSVGISYTLK